MGLDELNEDVTAAYRDLDETHETSLDRETRNELAVLAAVFGVEDVDELLRRGVHALFRSTVDTGDLDFHLRRGYDVTYDEYLLDETKDTYNERGGGTAPPDDDRRYRF